MHARPVTFMQEHNIYSVFVSLPQFHYLCGPRALIASVFLRLGFR